MKTANELRNITNNARNAYAINLANKARAILDNSILPVMVEEARKGNDNAFVRVNCTSCWALIHNELASAGYRASYKNNIVSIYWRG